MLKVGIIGLGVGEQHIQGYRRHPRCEVVALCDLAEEKLSNVGGRYPEIYRTTKASEILEDRSINVVSIASYDNDHGAQVCQALDHNKHVFVEKPLCLYEAEAIEIRNRLRQKPHLKLTSNLILRKSPRFQALKKMIETGGMGDIYYLEGDYNYGRIEKITEGWRGKIDFYSVVYGGGVHLIDLMLWLNRDEVLEVSAYGSGICTRNTQYHYNDLVAAILKFKSGAVGKMTANFGCVFPHFHPLAVYGTKATFINGRKSGELYRSRDPKVEPEAMVADYPGVHKGDFLLSFIDAILNDGQPEVTAQEIFAAMSVCFAIEKAVQRNEIIAVKNIWEEK